MQGKDVELLNSDSKMPWAHYVIYSDCSRAKLRTCSRKVIFANLLHPFLQTTIIGEPLYLLQLQPETAKLSTRGAAKVGTKSATTFLSRTTELSSISAGVGRPKTSNST